MPSPGCRACGDPALDIGWPGERGERVSASPAAADDVVTEGPMRHEAMFYAGDEGFVTGALPFVAAGLDSGEPVLVAVPEANGVLLRSALGADAGFVKFRDMTR